MSRSNLILPDKMPDVPPDHSVEPNEMVATAATVLATNAELREEKAHAAYIQGVQALLAPTDLKSFEPIFAQFLALLRPPRSAQIQEDLQREVTLAKGAIVDAENLLEIQQHERHFKNRAAQHSEFIKPYKERIHRLHKQICEQETAENRLALEIAAIYNSKARDFITAEQDRVRKENEEKLRKAREEAERARAAEIAKVKAEADRLKAAANEAAEGGDTVDAEILMEERKAIAARAKELKDAPLEIAPVELLDAPKAKGGAMRENWDVEITSIDDVPLVVVLEFLAEEKSHELFETFLRRKANKQKERFDIPGVRAFKSTSTLVTRKT